MAMLGRTKDVVLDLGEQLFNDVSAYLPLEIVEAIQLVQVPSGLDHRSFALSDRLNIDPRGGIRKLAEILVKYLGKEKRVVLDEDVFDHAPIASLSG